ncbi:hypothetical protein TorRG33x02_044220 [Trema orientale]|uniref:Uncharacterized protein n=1 Tax=Trema orientale TaxID=63057 RepID=A0A2P5FPB4_TREOI|nr:hypothetical protein TorRG33x02_044220 [Trema orientale]
MTEKDAKKMPAQGNSAAAKRAKSHVSNKTFTDDNRVSAKVNNASVNVTFANYFQLSSESDFQLRSFADDRLRRQNASAKVKSLLPTHFEYLRRR